MAQLGYTDLKAKGKGVTLNVRNQMVVLHLKKGVVAKPAALATAVIDAGYRPVTLYKPIANGKKIVITTEKIGN